MHGMKHAHMLAELAIRGREVFAETGDPNWDREGCCPKLRGAWIAPMAKNWKHLPISIWGLEHRL